MRVTQIADKFGTVIEGSPDGVRSRSEQRQGLHHDPRGVVVFSGFGTKLPDFDRYIRSFGEKDS